MVAMSPTGHTGFWALGGVGISSRLAFGQRLVMVAPHGDKAKRTLTFKPRGECTNELARSGYNFAARSPHVEAHRHMDLPYRACRVLYVRQTEWKAPRISISRNHNRRSGQDIPGNRESQLGQRSTVPEDRSHDGAQLGKRPWATTGSRRIELR